MDLTPEEFIEGLFSPEAHAQPSDKECQEVLELPKWHDEKLYNQGRRFFWNNCFAVSTNSLYGLVAVFAVPSILKVLATSKRSSSAYTAYKRYVSTFMHVLSWYEYELKPGTTSWKSLYTIRSRHFRAGKAATMQGNGTVSQRDIALTLFGFFGFILMKPEAFGVTQFESGDWQAFIHFWANVGYMIGLEDRYNICRKTEEETRQVFKVILDKVYTPCLDNVPEYFEHMCEAMLEGLSSVNPTISTKAIIYHAKYLANVPGYIINEKERQEMQSRLKEALKGKSLDTGVPSSDLIHKSLVEGLPDLPPRLHYYKDYETFDSVPAYKWLTLYEKYKLIFNVIILSIYNSYLGRVYFNLNYRFSLFLINYFPYLAFFKYGLRKSFVNMFVESPKDDTVNLPNTEYYKREPLPWYKQWLEFVW